MKPLLIGKRADRMLIVMLMGCALSSVQSAPATTNYCALESSAVGILNMGYCATERKHWPGDLEQIQRLTNALGDVAEEDLVGLLVALVRKGLTYEIGERGWPKVTYSADDETAEQITREFRAGFRAITVLGDWHRKDVSDFLAQVARTTASEMYRDNAVQAVIRINDSNMVAFAKEMLTRSGGDKYPNYMIYRDLRPYAMSRENESTRNAVLQLIMSIVSSEPGWGNELDADGILYAASEQWRKSCEREAFLERFRDTANTTYYADQLKALQAIPASERTHVDVHPLRSASPAPLSPAQPPAPASTNAFPASH